MRYKSKKIKGHGRGKFLGFPTINLEIPKRFNTKEGIYAVWVIYGNKKYKGAMHFGPVPTFGERNLSLEVFLIEVNRELISDSLNEIEFELVKWMRDIKEFTSEGDLIIQMKEDVRMISDILADYN